MRDNDRLGRGSEHNEIDELLDHALASYAGQEPDPALRARITARVAEAAPRPYRRFWLFGPAAACAAALLFAFLMHPAAHAPAPRPDTESPVASAPEPASPVTAAPQQTVHPRSAPASHRTRRTEQAGLIRASSFPTPSPMTAEERALLQFAAEYPEQARQVLTMTDEEKQAPIKTAPITIDPIHIAALADAAPPRADD